MNRRSTHLELPDDLFVEVFRAGVCSHGDKVAAIDVLFPHAPLSLGNPGNPLPLQPPCLPLLLGFATVVGRLRLRAGASARPQPQDAAYIAPADSIPPARRSLGLQGRAGARLKGGGRAGAVGTTGGIEAARLFCACISHGCDTRPPVTSFAELKREAMEMAAVDEMRTVSKLVAQSAEGREVRVVAR